ncbi:hypothetical protein CRM22_005825 [Opisthorchis felineus]|uniref:Pseudouridine synthase RsuA/RluA-like domain-containing protein n=2 Tax=Opisthorchis felineus TaxID=147828 RepID=A0A4V3SEQ9_OPIFE|nr:hypothetical protein CRM22_005825 [Opisthorchis felineus]
MQLQSRFQTISVCLLKLYIFCMWSLLMFYEVWIKRRERWISLKDLEIVYEAEGLIVVDKHPDLLINHQWPWAYCLSLQMQLFFNRPSRVSWKLRNMFYFVHRLDYATSGLICIACDQQTARLLGKAFSLKTVGKQYLALVWGHVGQDGSAYNPTYVTAVRPEVYHIHVPLGEIEYHWQCGRKQTLTTTADQFGCQNLRESSTIAVVLEHGRLFDLPASRLLLIPHTGRHHQLRVHCASVLGHPIAGDLIYTKWPSTTEDRSLLQSANHRLPRMMLHAYNLKFDLSNIARKASSGRLPLSGPITSGVLNLYSSSQNPFNNSTIFWKVERKFSTLDQWRDVYNY